MLECCAGLTHQNLVSFDCRTIVSNGSPSRVDVGEKCAFDVAAGILMCDAIDQAGGSPTMSRQTIVTPRGTITVDSSRSYATQTAALNEAILRLCSKAHAVPAGCIFPCVGTTQTSQVAR